MNSFAFFVSGGFVSARAGPHRALRPVAVFLQGLVFASPVAALSGEHLVEVVATLLVLLADGLHDAQQRGTFMHSCLQWSPLGL